MMMNKENRDSLISITYDTIVTHHYSNARIGVLKQYTPDYTSALDLNNNYFISNSGQILFHEKDTSVFSFSEVEKEVKKNMLKLASDTIAPTYYHTQGDTRSASQIIGTIKPKAMLYAKEKEDYNDEVNSGAFTLMLLIVILYAYNSYSHWTSLIGKIKMAIRN
jgi:hypothetical protein